MAYGRWVLTAKVVVPAGTATGGVNGTASYANGTGAASKWAPPFPVTFLPGQIVYADDTAPGSTPTGPQQLYQAIIAINATGLRAYADTDAVGHAATNN
jgi:hypothetical protein